MNQNKLVIEGECAEVCVVPLSSPSKYEESAYEYLCKVLAFFASEASQTVVYQNHWKVKFALENVTRAWKGIGGVGKVLFDRKVSILELREIADDKLLSIGFRKYRFEGAITYWIIPIWAFNFIGEDDTMLWCIDNTMRKKNNCDLDVRDGCIAYGFEKNSAA